MHSYNASTFCATISILACTHAPASAQESSHNLAPSQTRATTQANTSAKSVLVQQLVRRPTLGATPNPMLTHVRAQDDFTPVQASLAVGGVPTPFNYATGLEPEQGFAPGHISGQGNGPYPEPWGVRTSTPMSANEAHIDLANPSTGLQHARVSYDPALPTPPPPPPPPQAYFRGDFVTDARIPQNASSLPNVLAPVTIVLDLAITTDLSYLSSVYQLVPQSRSEGLITASMQFWFDGRITMIDDDAVCGVGLFCALGTWDTTGGYKSLVLQFDPCNGFLCSGGANAGSPCSASSDCPGGECRGQIRYYYDGQPRFTGTIHSARTLDQFLLFSDNGSFGHADFDNLVITTEASCDCDGNLVADVIDIADGAVDDCNKNGVPDTCDLASGTSQDCNSSSIPDECESPADCQPNGVSDICDLVDGTSIDCNANDIPDECDIADETSVDCNANGTPDECEADTGLAQNQCAVAHKVCPGSIHSGTTAGTTPDGSASCGLSGATPDVWYRYVPESNGILTISLCGSSYDTVLSVHSGCPGLSANQLACNDDSCGTQSTVTLNVARGTEYKIRVSGYSGSTGAFQMSLAGPKCSGDCNANGIPDECDIETQESDDCDSNTVPDDCQLTTEMLSEGFTTVPGLTALGWQIINRSQPTGTTSWFQGDSSVFAAHSGASNTYAGANYNSTGSTGTISTWLLSPVLTLADATTVSFYTRTIASSQWPDRLEVRLSLAGSSTDVGTTATSVGTFTMLLAEINPNLAGGGYPTTWTQYQLPLIGVGAPQQGRLAFRYFVTDGGINGANSNYIGIDSLTIISNEDLNGNGVLDFCEETAQIPAVSTWGIVILLLGVAAAGTCVLRRVDMNQGTASHPVA